MPASSILHRLQDNVTVPTEMAPLLTAIDSGAAIVYVGAGVSMSAGLPGWKELLKSCVKYARSKTDKPGPCKFIERLIENDSDFLTAAELLQIDYGNALYEHLRYTFERVREPSAVHRAISRIPFSLVVTTNYDGLLESCYPAGQANVYTHLDSEDILGCIKRRAFAVVKIHGDISKPTSVVLTRTQIRNLMHLRGNDTFNRCLSTLLSLNTFLFIGSSLKDPDLLRMMDTARLAEGEHFGPHYAILFADEVNESYIRFLAKEYKIHTILCREPIDPDNLLHVDSEWKTKAVCSFLKHLSGQIASGQFLGPSPHSSATSTFNLLDSVDVILRDTTKRTGSDLCKVALVRGLDIQALHVVHEVALETTSSSFDLRKREESFAGPLIPPGSPLSNLFLQGGETSRDLYLSDLANPMLTSVTSTSPFYHRSVPSAKSLLACQILADGERVGVIAIESRTSDAYTAEHLAALHYAARQAGAAFAEYLERRRSYEGVAPFIENMQLFSELMDLSRQLKPLEMCYLIYQIDYAAGIMEGHFDRSRVPTNDRLLPGGMKYCFGDSSLACRVLRERKSETVPDAEKDIRKRAGILSQRGVDYFMIKGPVYGTPIRVEGYVSSVLVCWSNATVPAKRIKMKKFSERISRMAHLVANAPDRDKNQDMSARAPYRFFREVNHSLARFDLKSDWTLQNLRDSHFRRQAIQVLIQCLTSAQYGLARVRLWKREIDGVDRFRCIYSYSIKKAMFPGTKQENEYVNNTTSAEDPYCRYTLARGPTYPYAVVQHSSMFGQYDSNYERLHKDPNGSWIVCPIVHNKKVLGYVSADNHYPILMSAPNPVKEEKLGHRISAYQRRMVDFVAELLTSIMWYESLRPRGLRLAATQQ